MTHNFDLGFQMPKWLLNQEDTIEYEKRCERRKRYVSQLKKQYRKKINETHDIEKARGFVYEFMAKVEKTRFYSYDTPTDYVLALQTLINPAQGLDKIKEMYESEFQEAIQDKNAPDYEYYDFELIWEDLPSDSDEE